MFRKIYLSLYLKGFERVTNGFTVSWKLDWTATYWPHSNGHNCVSFPFSWAAQPGAWGPSLPGTCFSFQHLLSNCNCSIGGLRSPSAWSWFSLPHLISNWLNFLCTELLIIWRPLFFLCASQFRTQCNPSTVKVISWYSSTGCTGYLHRCISYFDSLAGVTNLSQINFEDPQTCIIKKTQKIIETCII